MTYYDPDDVDQIANKICWVVYDRQDTIWFYSNGEDWDFCTALIVKCRIEVYWCSFEINHLVKSGCKLEISVSQRYFIVTLILNASNNKTDETIWRNTEEKRLRYYCCFLFFSPIFQCSMPVTPKLLYTKHTNPEDRKIVELLWYTSNSAWFIL